MARNFNGTTDKIVADAAAGFSEQVAYSVACWLKAASTITQREFYSEGRGASANPFLLLSTSTATSGKAMVVVRNDAGGTSQIASVSTALTVMDSTWHHFIYAQDASGHWQVYVDGVADGTAHGTYTTGTTTIDRLGIGLARRNTEANFFAGDIAEVAVFHRQLSAVEAVHLASGSPASELGPDHYWPIWGADSPEPDIGNG